MAELHRTVLYDRHVGLGARVVDFGGWEMPLLYPTGIVAEHLATRKGAGLFDVSHMGRLIFRGPGAVRFLQYVLGGNVEALDPGEGQYTAMPAETGGGAAAGGGGGGCAAGAAAERADDVDGGGGDGASEPDGIHGGAAGVRAVRGCGGGGGAGGSGGGTGGGGAAGGG